MARDHKDKAPHQWPSTWLFDDHRAALPPIERLIDVAQDIRLLLTSIFIVLLFKL